MIKLKVINLLNAESVLAKLKLKAEAEDTKLDFKVTYKIVKLLEKLEPEYKDIYEQRLKILKKFGSEKSKDEKTGEDIFSIPDENMNEFNKYWSQFLDIDIEVFGIYKFTPEELGPISEISISDVIKIKPFMEENEEQAPPRENKIFIDLEPEQAKEQIEEAEVVDEVENN